MQRVGAVMDEKKREMELEEIERIKAELAELKRRKDILDAIPPKKRRPTKAKKQTGSGASSTPSDAPAAARARKPRPKKSGHADGGSSALMRHPTLQTLVTHSRGAPKSQDTGIPAAATRSLPARARANHPLLLSPPQ